jgi:hypothetical protein
LPLPSVNVHRHPQVVAAIVTQLKIFNAGGYEGWCQSPRGVMPGA